MIGSNNSCIHIRPGVTQYTALRINPDKNANFINPQINIYNGDKVTIIDEKNGYGKIKGMNGWCNMNYLWKKDSQGNLKKCKLKNILSNSSSHLSSHLSSHSSSNQQKSIYGCTHNTCINNPNMGGIGALIVVKYNGRNYVIFGRERGGSNGGKFNVIGGKRENGECPIYTLYREVAEEIKILPIHNNPKNFDWSSFNNIFKNSGTIKCSQKGRTLIFFGIYNVNLPKIIDKINRKINEANQNPNLPYPQKEMSEIQLVSTDCKMYNGVRIHGLSSYAKSVLQIYGNYIDNM